MRSEIVRANVLKKRVREDDFVIRRTSMGAKKRAPLYQTGLRREMARGLTTLVQSRSTFKMKGLELKSLKEYLFTYRNLGIFQENIVNQVLEDVVRAAKPVWAVVHGNFNPRGGIGTNVEARWPRDKSRSRSK